MALDLRNHPDFGQNGDVCLIHWYAWFACQSGIQVSCTTGGATDVVTGRGAVCLLCSGERQ